ncbi:tail protein X [Paraburkholderia tropica]|uniref:tail protein X n=1 Tax=Paraburkholderia tropica TaxID=92647 RepID=UPI0030191BB7
MKIVARQGDTVDAICWRYYGRTDGTVETVLEVNEGLADLGAVLPSGTVVELPDFDKVQSSSTLLQLFD